jgi:hypothetical protein
MLLHFPNLVMGPGLNGSGACAEKNVTHAQACARVYFFYVHFIHKKVYNDIFTHSNRKLNLLTVDTYGKWREVRMSAFTE